jgi:hypothetical protein
MNPMFFGQNVVVAGGGPVQVAADNFDAYANGALLQSQTGWSLVGGSIKINKPASDGQAVSNSAATNCVRRTDTYTENQYAEVTMGSVATNASGIGPAVACQSGAFSLYGVYYFPSPLNSESLYLLKYNAGTKTDLANSGFGTVKCLAGDVVRLERTGTGAATRLTVKKNGVNVTGLISIDPAGTYLGGGTAGIWGDGNPGTVSAALWAGGNL